LKTITNLFIAAVELLEAEGRDLRRSVHETARGLALVLVAALLALAGLGLLGYAAFEALTFPLGVAGSSAVVGAAALVVASGVYWISLHHDRGE